MKEKEVLYKPPADQYKNYKVHTSNCYDSVIERNLNTGLPKRVSYITEKDLKGKIRPKTNRSKV